MDTCEFCNQIALKEQIILRNKTILLLYPHSPIIPEHLIIIPVRHIGSFENLNETEILEIHKIVNKILKFFRKKEKISGFNLFSNVGEKAGQHIPHFHWHLFIRLENEKISPYKILNNPKLKEKLTKKEWLKRKNRIIKTLS